VILNEGLRKKKMPPRKKPKEEKQENGNMLKLVLTGIFGVLGLILFFTTYYTIEEYEAVVLTRFGQIQSVNMAPGLNFKIPGVHSANFIRTDIQEMSNKDKANTFTIDNQEVDVWYKLFYRIPKDEERITFVWRNAQDYKQRLQAIVLDRLKREMGKVNTQNVASHRGELCDKIKNVVAEEAKTLGVEVTDFQMPNLEYSKTFQQAVDTAASAKANVETREQELQQERKKAETAVTKANGEADSKLALAVADAKAIEMRGKAEATAIKAKNDALAAAAQLVEYTKALNWNGALPATMLSNTVPFMNVDEKGVVPRRQAGN